MASANPGDRPAAGMPADSTLFFFNSDEAKFVTAAIDRLIPADAKWAGAKDAGVLYYIDRQLAGAYGAGARMYLKGPWISQAPVEQGYQLKHTPADLYRVGINEVRKYASGKHGKEFWELAPDDADGILKELESGTAKLDSIPAPAFFETLLANTIEGYFADPIYGGNRDMVSWRMVGFPGAYAQYLDLVDQYDYEYSRPPLSLGDDAMPHEHAMAE